MVGLGPKLKFEWCLLATKSIRCEVGMTIKERSTLIYYYQPQKSLIRVLAYLFRVLAIKHIFSHSFRRKPA